MGLIDTLKQQKPPSPKQAVLGARKDIYKALTLGYDCKDIWRAFCTEFSITISYSHFTRLVNKHVIEASYKPEVTSATETDKKTNPSLRNHNLASFHWNPNVNEDELY